MKNYKNTTSSRSAVSTVSKGYRLKPSTHKLIKKAQRSFDATQDTIISKAIMLFRKENRISSKQIKK